MLSPVQGDRNAKPAQTDTHHRTDTNGHAFLARHSHVRCHSTLTVPISMCLSHPWRVCQTLRALQMQPDTDAYTQGPQRLCAPRGLTVVSLTCTCIQTPRAGRGPDLPVFIHSVSLLTRVLNSGMPGRAGSQDGVGEGGLTRLLLGHAALTSHKCVCCDYQALQTLQLCLYLLCNGQRT